VPQKRVLKRAFLAYVGGASRRIGMAARRATRAGINRAKEEKTPMATRLGKVWERGEAALNGWLSIPSTVTAEMVARQDYDSIVVDLQHGLIDYQTALTMIQAIAAGSDATAIGRPPWNEPGIIMKLLDAGAWGILCPMVNTPDDAETLCAPATTPRAASAASARPAR
jgi:2-keto-3-deoxy-L-rhamnonate aldolase RhmA